MKLESKIVVDSCVDFNGEVFDNNDQIERIPFNIIIDDEEIVDKELDTNLLISKMKESKSKIVTSCPSPNDFLAAYKKCKNTFVVTISSKLSGSHNSALVAKDILKEESPDNSVYVFDSKSATVGETLVVLKIIQLLKEKIPVLQIVEKTNEYIANMKTFLILKSYNNLVKNGRISSVKALIGSLINIVPIMGDNGDGEIVLKDKVRGHQNAYRRLIDMIGQDNIDFKNTILGITHVNAEEKAKKIKSEIEKKYSFKEVLIFKAGGLSTVYADDGGIVIAY